MYTNFMGPWFRKKYGICKNKEKFKCVLQKSAIHDDWWDIFVIHFLQNYSFSYSFQAIIEKNSLSKPWIKKTPTTPKHHEIFEFPLIQLILRTFQCTKRVLNKNSALLINISVLTVVLSLSRCWFYGFIDRGIFPYYVTTFSGRIPSSQASLDFFLGKLCLKQRQKIQFLLEIWHLIPFYSIAMTPSILRAKCRKYVVSL